MQEEPIAAEAEESELVVAGEVVSRIRRRDGRAEVAAGRAGAEPVVAGDGARAREAPAEPERGTRSVNGPRALGAGVGTVPLEREKKVGWTLVSDGASAERLTKAAAGSHGACPSRGRAPSETMGKAPGRRIGAGD